MRRSLQSRRPKSDIHREASPPSQVQLHPLLQLQQQIGNRAVRRMLNRPVIQRFIPIHTVNHLLTQFGTGALTNVQVKQQFKTAAQQDVRAVLGNPPNIRQFLRDHSKVAAICEELNNFVDVYQVTDYTNADTLEFIRQEVNKKIQRIKEEVAIDELPSLSLPRVKIGNEFTFTNHALKTFGDTFKGKKPKGSKEWKDEYRKALEAGPYMTALQQWEAQMTNLGFAGARGTDKYGYTKSRFSFPSIDWHYDVTVDDACVEVITPPVEARELEKGEIALAMDQYIFGIANTIGLVADPEVGSGHINIDRQTSVEQGGRDLYVFLKAFMEDSEYWKQNDPDFLNAPFPDEFPQGSKGKKSPQQTQLEAILKDCQDKVEQNEDIDNGALAIDLIKKVFTENLLNEPKPSSPHYQAVNLEHFNTSEDTPEGERRIEIRRVKAQQNRIELLNELDRLFTLMEGKRPPQTSNRFG